ncbi:hypothetical protein BKA80DRAFT_122877 [Phyllosticta citrichinensis]
MTCLMTRWLWDCAGCCGAEPSRKFVGRDLSACSQIYSTHQSYSRLGTLSLSSSCPVKLFCPSRRSVPFEAVPKLRRPPHVHPTPLRQPPMPSRDSPARYMNHHNASLDRAKTVVVGPPQQPRLEPRRVGPTWRRRADDTSSRGFDV